MSKVQGVVAVYVHEGRVVAYAADFAPDRPGGFTMREAQESRVRDSIAMAVMRACCSPLVTDTLSPYYARTVVEAMPGKVTLIPVGYEVEEITEEPDEPPQRETKGGDDRWCWDFEDFNMDKPEAVYFLRNGKGDVVRFTGPRRPGIELAMTRLVSFLNG